MAEASISVDEFQALEQKVLQTVELIRKEREARTAAESRTAQLETERNAAQSEAADLREKLSAATNTAQTEVESLQREREAVRQRVEKMLATMDELL